MSPRAWLRAGGLFGAALVGAACSAVLNPERIDDIIRCGTANDCPKPENNRYVNVCVYGGEDEAAEPTSFDQVCVAEFAPVDCQPQAYGADSEFAELYNEAASRPSLYLGACEGTPGAQGCLPGPEGCLDGLVVDPNTLLCDDTDPNTFPAFGDHLTNVHVAQDVLDQFCKNYFCDSDFVCDRSKNKFVCKPCEHSGTVGKGRCADVYLYGERSPVYLSNADNESACPAQADGRAVNFGTLPADPTPDM